MCILSEIAFALYFHTAGVHRLGNLQSPGTGSFCCFTPSAFEYSYGIALKFGVFSYATPSKMPSVAILTGKLKGPLITQKWLFKMAVAHVSIELFISYV